MAIQSKPDSRKTAAESPVIAHREAPVLVSASGVLQVAIIGIFLIMLIGALYFAQDLLVPLALAFMLSILLSPIVRVLARRGVPEGISAIGIVVSLLGLLAVGGWSLSGPVSQWLDEAPRIGTELKEKISSLRASFGFVEQVTNQVNEMASTADPKVQQVVVKEPGLLNRAATGVPETIAKIGLTLFMLLFLLSSGDLFREKLVKILPTMSDKKRALHISRDVEREVSRYLLTITGINALTGAIVGTGLWIIGMPNPLLWGVLAAFLTYIPYLGALIGMSLVGAIGLVTFDSVGMALAAPAIYFGAATLEGQFLTPMIVGRRLEMNAVAILISVAFWGWLWGVIGVLIAVPILVIMKVIADYVEGMEPFGAFLAARDVPLSEEAEKAVAEPAA